MGNESVLLPPASRFSVSIAFAVIFSHSRCVSLASYCLSVFSVSPAESSDREDGGFWFVKQKTDECPTPDRNYKLLSTDTIHSIFHSGWLGYTSLRESDKKENKKKKICQRAVAEITVLQFSVKQRYNLGICHSVV